MKLNPRDLQKAMQRFGIQQQEVDAQEVIIRCSDKDIVIEKPQVAKVNMMGQDTWQISGNAVEKPRSSEPEIKEEDIQTVMQQANVSKEKALEAIKSANGDLAQAILNLQS
ncbi:nascent polypeptide-associated complex protein [Candidatus Woesearchaeota archaeon]|nr:nascent polypeptide-associated complex protein [Candidatus Woesearchaeota archaeon]MBW3016597.1 nascent polypeptide-associated complex protein [Candidatus Woesearchaeota archaeon]